MEVIVFSNPQTDVIFKLDLSVVIAAIALWVSIVVYRFDRRKLKTSRAIQLSEEYAVLLKSMATLNRIISVHPEIMRIINRRPRVTKGLLFSLDELESFYANEDINILVDFFNGKTLNYKKTLEIFKISDTPLVTLNCNEEDLTDELIAFKFRDLLKEILNNLEHFSMNFTFGLANDKLIYQSLHQSFFTVVNLLYFPISFMNKNVQDKYYTNIIALYNSWVKKETKLKKRITKKISRIVNPKHSL